MSYLFGGMVAVLVGMLFYITIPTYWNRLKSAKELKDLLHENQLMLTFDDGPDSRYTDKLLDVLAENNIKATFFVVAAKVPANINTIRRMQAEGHTIALHSFCHQSHWLMGYRNTKKDFEHSLAILGENHIKIKYYRPAWGQINLFSALFAKKYGLKMVFWHVMAQDWSKKSTAETIMQKLTKSTGNCQTVICLHDSGEGSGGAQGAPLNTICALALLLPVWHQQGIEFVTPCEVF